MSKVPAGWVKNELAEICRKTISYGIVQTGPSILDGVPCLRVVDLSKQNISLSEIITTSKEINDSYKKTILEKDEIVMALRGMVGLVRLINKDFVGANITRGLARISPNIDKVYPEFLLWALRSPNIRSEILSRVAGSALQEISLGELRKVEVLLPPLPEQTKIAQILSTWDKAIATTEKLIGNSQQQKKALMQSLLTGKKRLPGFEGEWIPFAVERFLTLRKEKFNPKLSEERNICIELEHIEQGAGVLNGTSITNNQMSDKSRFYTGDILFGKLRPYLRKYWFADFSGVCSTEIWVFKNQADKCLPEYLYQLIQTDHFIDGTNISSGTHMPRADWKVVKDIIFKLPPLPEQQKIAAILTAADNEIDLLQKKLAFLKQEKAALMQQLLTGKRRVKVEAA